MRFLWPPILEMNWMRFCLTIVTFPTHYYWVFYAPQPPDRVRFSSLLPSDSQGGFNTAVAYLTCSVCLSGESGKSCNMSVFLFKASSREIKHICVYVTLCDSIRFSTMELWICWRKLSTSLICIAENEKNCFASHYELVFYRLFSCLFMDLKKKKLTLQPAAPQGAESDLCDRYHWWVNVVLPLKHIEFWHRRGLPTYSRLWELVCVFHDFLIPYI